MERMKIVMLALALAVIVTASYSILGQGPGDDDPVPGGGVVDETTPPARPPIPGEEDDPDGEPGPVGIVNELLLVPHDWDAASVEAIKDLLDEGADPNVVDENGLTGVHSAILNSDLNPVAQQQLDAFLEGGADPNKATESGLAPIHMAAGWRGSGGLVASLIRHGANPDLPDPDGKTPLEIALQNGNEGAVSVLKQATAARPVNYDELAQAGKTSRWLWKKLDEASSSKERWDAVKEWAGRLAEEGHIDKDNVDDFVNSLKDQGILKGVEEAEKEEAKKDERGEN